jgi:thiamine-monophosphate kinase
MESELIAHLRARLPSHPLLRLGIGDDAAVLELGGRHGYVVTVDMVNDGVDFIVGEADPLRVGRKALAVNLSDLAAMAARPIAGVVALVLPRHGALDLAVDLYRGMLPLAERYKLAIAGGDTNCWDGPLAVSATLIGEVTENGPLRRDGAEPGDRIIVTGRFGGSILGRHFDFEPRVHEALALAGRYRLHAGLDCSDGLSLDLSRMAAESGCGAVIDLGSVPVHPDARRLAEQRSDGLSPLEHALADGEDFELIMAVPDDDARRMAEEQPLPIPVTDIGQFVAEPGLWQRDAAGNRQPLSPRGYVHGSPP